ncbi:MAG: nucleotide exchange factor GrpE [Rickettsiales bacterium]
MNDSKNNEKNEQQAEIQEEKSESAIEAEKNDTVTDLRDTKISRLEKECADLHDKWVRCVAEIENIQKRSQKALEDSNKYAISGFAGDMVNVLENLKRALEIIPSDDDNDDNSNNELLKKLGEGVELTMQELISIFKKHGIERIDPLGKKFDHNLHQALSQVEDDSKESGTVIQVLQAGYMIADRLLRPAMVTVSTTSAKNKHKVDTTA